mgnify:CR=1 FL=1
MQSLSVKDKKNKNKGRTISIIIHALLLLIAFFYYLPEIHIEENEDKPPYAVKVDFTFQESSLSKLAHDDEGAQRAKSESAPKEEKQAETPETPQEVVKPEEIEVTKPAVIDVPKPDIKIPTQVPVPKDEVVVTTKAPVDEAPVRVTEPSRPTRVEPTKTVPASGGSSSTTGSTSGTSTSKPSTVDGTPSGTGKGNSGTGAGKDKGNDGDAGMGNTSDGTGEYDGSGDGVFGRKIIFRNIKDAKAAINISGKVVTKICINRAGIVTYVELIGAETTIRDKPTLRNYLKAAYGYKFQPDLTAPKEQCGKLKFTVDNTANNKFR